MGTELAEQLNIHTAEQAVACTRFSMPEGSWVCFLQLQFLWKAWQK